MIDLRKVEDVLSRNCPVKLRMAQEFRAAFSGRSVMRDGERLSASRVLVAVMRHAQLRPRALLRLELLLARLRRRCGSEGGL
jgi:hypothetical protein